MDLETRLNLIKRNTAEIVTEDELKTLLKTKEHPSVYLGTAITGRPHIGYFVWVLKLADFLKAGFKVKVLLADIHGSLDNTPWEILESRYEHYKMVILPMFQAIGVDTQKVEFVKGSSFQLKEKYIHDLLKMTTSASVHDCMKASSEVVKQSDNPKLSGLVYPIMQSLDEEYLDVDIQYGGIDQRKILMFARENLPKVGYKPRIEVMTPLIPGLQGGGGKMSASAKGSKIDLLDTPEDVRKKISAAFCPEGIVEGNGILSFMKYVVMVYKGDQKKDFVIKRDKKFGGDVSYKTYEELEKDFANKKLHPADLKKALAAEVNILLEPIRKAASGKESLIKKAYPES